MWACVCVCSWDDEQILIDFLCLICWYVVCAYKFVRLCVCALWKLYCYDDEGGPNTMNYLFVNSNLWSELEIIGGGDGGARSNLWKNDKYNVNATTESEARLNACVCNFRFSFFSRLVRRCCCCCYGVFVWSIRSEIEAVTWNTAFSFQL